MKYIYYLLGFLALLLLAYIGLCWIGPKNFDTVSNTSINAPAPVVFNLVNSIEQSNRWNQWVREDTAMIITMNDISSGVGAGSKWESAATGNGSQKIIESVPNQSVKTELAFDGWDGVNYAEMNLAPEGSQTNVSWTFESGAPLPFLMRGGMMLSGMKGSMQKSYDKGLSNLKEIAEQRANEGIYDGYAIKELVLDEKNYVMNRQEVDISKIQQFYTTNLGALFSKVQGAGVQMQGMPCGLFFAFDSNGSQVDMAAAIPVDSPVNIDGAQSYQIPSKRAIQVDYTGDHDLILKAHDAISTYMLDKGYLKDLPYMEEHITDPKEVTRLTYYFSERG